MQFLVWLPLNFVHPDIRDPNIISKICAWVVVGPEVY